MTQNNQCEPNNCATTTGFEILRRKNQELRDKIAGALETLKQFEEIDFSDLDPSAQMAIGNFTKEMRLKLTGEVAVCSSGEKQI